jgi:hypothetical protein
MNQPLSTPLARLGLMTERTIVGAVKGKDYIFIGTDTAAYIMQFVGAPFTFSIRQVGSSCGLIGQHALAFVDGSVFWMSDHRRLFSCLMDQLNQLTVSS